MVNNYSNASLRKIHNIYKIKKFGRNVKKIKHLILLKESFNREILLTNNFKSYFSTFSYFLLNLSVHKFIIFIWLFYPTNQDSFLTIFPQGVFNQRKTTLVPFWLTRSLARKIYHLHLFSRASYSREVFKNLGTHYEQIPSNPQSQSCLPSPKQQWRDKQRNSCRYINWVRGCW